MGFRFHKRLRLAPGINLNLSKSGLGISAGVKGFRVSAGPRGVRATATAPGTGLSVSHQVGVRRTAGSVTASRETIAPVMPNAGPSAEAGTRQSTWFGRSATLFLLGFLFPPFLLVGAVIFSCSWVAAGPTSARKFNAGRALSSRGKHREAAQAYLAALHRNSKNYEARRLLVITLADDLGELEEAHDHAVELMRADMQNPASQAVLISLRCGLNRPDEVVKLLSVVPPGAAVLTFAAEQLGEIGCFAHMIRILQGSPWLSDERHGEKLALLLGRAFVGNEPWEPASEVFKRGPINAPTRTDSNAVEFRYWLGVCYFQMGDTKKAKTYFAKVYAHDVGYREIERYMSSL